MAKSCLLTWNTGLPWWLSGKEPACRRRGFDPWVMKIPWRRKWQLTPGFLPGKSCGQRSLAKESMGSQESDTVQWLHHHHHQMGIQEGIRNNLYFVKSLQYEFVFFLKYIYSISDIQQSDSDTHTHTHTHTHTYVLSLQYRRCRRCRFDPWVRKIPWGRKQQTHSSILAWEIPWTEKPGGLQSKGLQRVGHNWACRAGMSAKKVH